MAGETQARRIGVFGGMFNPPHHGHIICAQEARAQLDLEVVLLVPTGDPPHRDQSLEGLPTRDQRLQMTELAVRGQPGLEVSTVELDRDGPSYMVDTLEELRNADPDAGFTLILGADQALSFGSWREPEQVIRSAEIAVATRVGSDWEAATAEVERVGGGTSGSGRVRGFEIPQIDLSSTLVRGHAAHGQNVSHFVPAGVGELIEQQGLYR